MGLKEETKRIKDIRVLSVDAKSILGEHVITKDLNVKKVFDLVIVFDDEQVEFSLVKSDEIRDLHLFAEAFSSNAKSILELKGRNVWMITDDGGSILAMGDKEKNKVAILKSLFPKNLKLLKVKKEIKNNFKGVEII